MDTAVGFMMVDLYGTRNNAYFGESITLPVKVNGYHSLVLKTLGGSRDEKCILRDTR